MPDSAIGKATGTATDNATGSVTGTATGGACYGRGEPKYFFEVPCLRTSCTISKSLALFLGHA